MSLVSELNGAIALVRRMDFMPFSGNLQVKLGNNVVLKHESIRLGGLTGSLFCRLRLLCDCFGTSLLAASLLGWGNRMMLSAVRHGDTPFESNSTPYEFPNLGISYFGKFYSAS